MQNAWRIAQVYAARTGVPHDTAFAKLFVTSGAHGTVDTAPSGVPVVPLDEPGHQEPLDMRPNTPKQSTNLRFDDATLTMLEALMEEKDRISYHDMLRVLIRRAYRALVARRSATDSTLRGALPRDHSAEEPL